MSLIVYPGSFNPITYGHTNIVERALHIFDHVIVAIGTSIEKDTDAHFRERIELCRQALACFGDHVRIEGFNSLLVDFVREKNTRFILRGLRTIADYDYEFQMLQINRTLAPEIEYVLLPTSHEWSFLSSTRVREIASLGGDVSDFVHPAVAEYLKIENKDPDR